MHSKAAFCLRIQQAAQADQIMLYVERLFFLEAVTACQEEELLIRQWRDIVTSGAAWRLLS